MTEKFELNPLNSGSALPIELKTNSTALTDLVDDLFGERIYLTHVQVRGYYYLSEENQAYHRAAGLPGTALILRRDKANQFDDYAIKVLDSAEHHIGWVPRTQNHIVARLMDAGKKIAAEARAGNNSLAGELSIDIYLED